MARLGSEKRPAVVRVQTQEKSAEIATICGEHGWHYIIGIEPDKPEDIADIEKLLNPPVRIRQGNNQDAMIPAPVAAA